MIDIHLNRISEHLAREYVRVFIRSPVITSLATLVTIAIGVVAIREDMSRQRAEQQRRQTLTYADQLTQMDAMQNSLKDLATFVGQQRAKLQESEQVISSLKEERDRIEPLLQADRKIVDAVFQLQEHRNSTNVRRERWIGFGLGVAASVLASFIYATIVFGWRRIRQQNEASA